MDVSIFLAKVISLYFLIVGVSMALNRTQYKSIITEICNNNAVLFISGLIALIIGILLVVSHNVWVASWPVAITIIGWMTLLKGASRVACPKFSLSYYNHLMKKRQWYWGSVILSIALGAYLGCYGYGFCNL